MTYTFLWVFASILLAVGISYYLGRTPLPQLSRTEILAQRARRVRLR